MQPLVSIIIPAYNPPADAFSRCMESVLQQTYRTTEIVLVDDGSTQKAAEEMDVWANRDSRVHVFHQPNRGVGSARNQGVESAQGEYISFVDADDCINTDWLQKAVEEAEKADADIVYGRVRMTVSPHIGWEQAGEMYSFVYEGSELWHVQEMLLLCNRTPLPGLPYLDFGPCGKLYRTKIVKKILFPTDMPLAEDQVFNHTMLRNSQRVVLTNIPAYDYIQNNFSATHRGRPDAVEVMLHSMDKIRGSLFEKSEINNAYYYRLVNEVMVGFQLAFIYDTGRPCSFGMKYRAIRQIFSTEPVKTAIRDVQLTFPLKKKNLLKMQMLKHRMYIPVLLFLTFREKKE